MTPEVFEVPQAIVRHEEEHLYAPRPDTEARRALSAALLRLRRAEHVQEIRTLKASGLSNLDLRAVRYLVQASRDGRNLSPKDLVVMLGTSSANVTNVIDRLVKKGFVERISHPTDRRARYLQPTAAAVQQVEALIGAHHSALVSQINQIDDDDAAIVANVLERISGALDSLADQRRAGNRQF